jgi:RNA polymerase sigma-19 factor, ECF subfamily
MNPEELQIWRAIQRKDEQVFQKFYVDHYRLYLLAAFRYLKDKGQSLEIVNDVFVTVWEDAQDIDIQTSLRSYIHRAVINRCINTVIKNKRDRDRQQQLLHMPQEVAESREMEENELKFRLYKEIDQLPEQCRKVFKLSRFEGKKKHEIADELGLSVKTVKNHLNRALKTLHKVLGDWKTLPLGLLLFNFFNPWLGHWACFVVLL